MKLSMRFRKRFFAVSQRCASSWGLVDQEPKGEEPPSDVLKGGATQKEKHDMVVGFDEIGYFHGGVIVKWWWDVT